MTHYLPIVFAILATAQFTVEVTDLLVFPVNLAVKRDGTLCVSTVPKLVMPLESVRVFIVDIQHGVPRAGEMNLDLAFAVPGNDIPVNLLFGDRAIEDLVRSSPDLREVKFEQFTFVVEGN